VTNLIDTSSFGGDPKNGGRLRRDFSDDPCGERLDWSRGLEDLRRQVGRSGQSTGPLLTKVIEQDIIPRLFLTHCDVPRPNWHADNQKAMLSAIDSEALTRLLLSSDPADKIIEQVQDLMDRGVSLQRIYLDMLAPIARRLGEFWEADRCTFIEMTIALSRLHWVLREIGRRNGEGLPRGGAKPRIYLAPCPGEQHTFGLMMIEEFFLHAGWELASERQASLDAILQAASEQSLDMLGISIGCEEFLPSTQELIHSIRSVSRNRHMSILLGGLLFRDKPHFADQISGATVVFNGINAVETAETLISPPSRLAAIE
jgi:methylmalonyl-CoA mutase cobalamin-binding subunit